MLPADRRECALLCRERERECLIKQHTDSSIAECAGLGWASRVLGAPLAVICEGIITGDAGMKKKVDRRTHTQWRLVGGQFRTEPYANIRTQ